MRKRILVSHRRKKAEDQIEKYTRLSARSTFAYTIFTALILVGVVFTIFQQQGFNKRQLELYELSCTPQVFVIFDSLSFVQEHNVFYHITNVGNSPALGLRSACVITPEKKNPLKQERIGELNADLFPTGTISGKSNKSFKQQGTWYLHFRVDFHDLRNQKYYYKTSYYLIFESPEDTATTREYLYGVQSSEYGKLGF